MNPYVKAFMDAVADEDAQKTKFLGDVATQGLAQFTTNCQVWLGEMWEECPGEIKAEIKDGRVWFLMNFAWEELRGQIYSGPWGRAQNTNWGSGPQRCMVLMGGEEREYKSFRNVFQLPVDTGRAFDGGLYNEVARAIDAVDYGRFLCECLAKKEAYLAAIVEREANQARYQREQLIDRIAYAVTDAELQAALFNARQERPDLVELFEKKAKEREGYLAEQARQLEAAEARQKVWNAEMKRLEEQARLMFHPFRLWKIRYGAKAQQEYDAAEEAEVPAFYETNDWSVRPGSDPNGYWPVVRWGQVVRVKPRHMIAVEEHPVNEPYDVPVGTLVRRTLQSETIEGLSVDVLDLSVLG